MFRERRREGKKIESRKGREGLTRSNFTCSQNLSSVESRSSAETTAHRSWKALGRKESKKGVEGRSRRNQRKEGVEGRSRRN